MNHELWASVTERGWQWHTGLAEEYSRWKGEAWSLTGSTIEHAVSMATPREERLAWAITASGSLTFEAHDQRTVAPALRDCNEQRWISVKKWIKSNSSWRRFHFPPSFIQPWLTRHYSLTGMVQAARRSQWLFRFSPSFNELTASWVGGKVIHVWTQYNTN